ncbi:MAG TPA: CheR family methyltransferase [Caulobacteraceae bacterium]|nr:CheR family methyltransferase [Caulobacteraceae bacterium]
MARKPDPSSSEPRRRARKAASLAATAPTLVVGVAASAATLPSLERLFAQGPLPAGVAFVISLRQSDGLDFATVAAALAPHGFAAEAVADGERAQAGRVYVGPLDRLMTLEGEAFRLAPAEQPPGERAAIDSFLISLAAAQQHRAVAVILAGMGSVGAAGVTAVKEQGGLAVAELDANRPGPEHLVDPAFLVDFVLPADQIAGRIATYADHLAGVQPWRDAAAAPPETAGQLARIAGILRSRTGHDFHGYKHNTFLRRVQRRMQVLQIDQVEAYIERLRTAPDEVGHLFQDLLIGVTQFFRDGLEFDLLRREVVPKLVEGRDGGEQIRIWVLGCATGEEAYSIAILMQEQLAKLDRPPLVQIFATDIDGRALTMARSGRYPESIAKDVSPERLARWFSKEGATYAVIKELREMCIFSQHNVVRDAPFSRIDLVSCRNLLIYLTGELQDRVIPLFHFSLKPGGFLFLGPSENVTRQAKLFAPIDRRHRIYRRLDTVNRVLPEFPLATGERGRDLAGRGDLAKPRADTGLGRQAERIADRYAPAYVLIDDQYETLNFSGRTGRFLEPAAGAASLNLLNLVHRDLRVDLRAALHAAATQRTVAKVERLQVGIQGEVRRVDLVVEPVIVPDAPVNFVVLFRDGGPVDGAEGEAVLSAPALRDEHVQRLEGELRLVKERLQAAIEELESTNEELKSSNEEYQSINEEMQSANEELETSKEELQSVNEELHTVNGELAHRVTDLARANSDLKNLLSSTQIATVFLDNDLRIKSFTPAVGDIFHLIDGDLGRPITHIAARIAYPELADDVRKVLRTLAPIEREVADLDLGTRHLVRVLPYRSIDNYIAGAVITFLDVTATVRAQAEAEEAGAQTREILESIADAFYALDGEMRFTYANRRALEDWGKRPEEVLGRRLIDVFPCADQTEAFEAQRRAAREGVPVHVETLSAVLHGWIAISAYPDASGGVSVYFRDISDRKRSEERQKLLMGELQHRVKNILAVVRSIANRTLDTSETLEEFAAHFDGRLRALARTQGVLSRHAEGEIELEEIVREELLSHAVHDDDQIEVSGPPIRLRQKAAEIMALALHELTTNAVKYGALASQAGHIAVTWRTTLTKEGRRLSLQWRESGVPLVDSAPSRTGFGRDLIERGLPYDLGAATLLEFSPGGIRCLIELPIPEDALVVEDADTKEAGRAT